MPTSEPGTGSADWLLKSGFRGFYKIWEWIPGGQNTRCLLQTQKETQQETRRSVEEEEKEKRKATKQEG